MQYDWLKLADSIALVYGGMELFLDNIHTTGGMMPFAFETPDIGLTAYSMAVYLVVGFVLSVMISRRRQLA